jgi:hypothetical protein
MAHLNPDYDNECVRTDLLFILQNKLFGCRGLVTLFQYFRFMYFMRVLIIYHNNNKKDKPDKLSQEVEHIDKY